MRLFEISTHAKVKPAFTYRAPFQEKAPGMRHALCVAVITGLVTFAVHDRAVAADGTPTFALVGRNLSAAEVAIVAQLGFAVVQPPKRQVDLPAVVLTRLIPPSGMSANAAIAVLSRALPMVAFALQPSSARGK